MLRLEKMHISGFKSFSDRTEIRFRDRITAVVGPNGCGKSNIGDAINWVLGEQSPKNLRGSRMKDVIFNGSRARKPKGMAEVSLELVSDNGPVSGGGRQVVITRRLFRSGDSEYLLNGAKTRLRDIQELLHAEHVGAKTYATIEQGRIDQILNAKPKDRRGLIEDAAGISGFKHKRRLARLKLEATQANLLRVNDIVTEVRRQINSIKRQAAKARRYQRLRDALREKETVRFALKVRELDAALEGQRRREAEARQEEAAAAAGLARSEADLAQARERLEEADRSYREASDSLHQLDLEIDREESRIRHCRERIAEADGAANRADDAVGSLGARLDEVRERVAGHLATVEEGAIEVDRLAGDLSTRQADLEECRRWVASLQARIEEVRRDLFESMNLAAERRNRARAIEEAIERNGAERFRLRGEQTEAREDHARLDGESRSLEEEIASNRQELERLREERERKTAALEEARSRVAAGREELDTAREQEHAAVARLQTLEDLSNRFAGHSDGVRVLLGAGSSSRLRTHGVIADYVEAGREIEGAAEAYLQGVLPTVILEDDTDARQAAEMLREEKIGRTTFLCKSQPVGAAAVGTSSNGRPPVPEEILRDSRVVGLLREGLKLKTRMNGTLQERIGDAVVVETLEAALDLHRKFSGADYIARSGEVVYASGMIAAGGKQAVEHGLLAHNRHVTETRTLMDRARSLIRTIEVRLDTDRATVRTLDEELAALRERLERAGQRQVELGLRSQRSTEDRERIGRRSEVLASELASLDEEAARLRDEQTEVLGEMRGTEEAHQDLERRLGVETASLREAENSLREKSEETGVSRARLAARQQQQEAELREQVRLEELVTELTERIDALRAEGAAARERAAEAAELLERTESDLTEHLGRQQERSTGLREMESGITARREDLAGREKEILQARATFEAIRERTRQAEVERARTEADRTHLDDLCHGELGFPACESVEAAGDALEGADLEDLEATIAEIRQKVEGIGPVNIMAIEEHSELEERHGFLTAQKEDLEKSMASLEEVIRKINRTSRDRFVTAFESIRENYREIFAVLFNGGRADLRLEEGEDVLECGIEILAQPPGKRLGSVQLLSGGEKALSAIALLFAIFRHQPSPFCLLDEVDAALDDVNVGRFTRMLGEYANQSQFILITHNKVSMESANLLYGVTMEEPGVSRVMSLQLGN